MPPMWCIDAHGESSGVNLKNYLLKIIKKERLSTTLEDIEIHYVYHTPDHFSQQTNTALSVEPIAAIYAGLSKPGNSWSFFKSPLSP